LIEKALPGPAVKRPRSLTAGLCLLALASLAFACGLNSSKKEYVLAEKFWTDGNYAAAVAEFDRVYARDSRGILGLQALYRSATTQTYFLSQYPEAIRKFKIFAEITTDREAAWNARAQVGEILFMKTEVYSEAATHYRAMIADNPRHPDSPLYLFRIARSEFFQWQFEQGLQDYRGLIKLYPESPYAERALYEIGVTYFTRGEQRTSSRENAHAPAGKESYQDAIDAFEQFLKHYPKSEWVPHARFGIASCLEEMDQLDAAYHAYEALKSTYPSPNVITIKLVRIRERKAQRSR
jgi:TolA-binding protein